MALAYINIYNTYKTVIILFYLPFFNYKLYRRYIKKKSFSKTQSGDPLFSWLFLLDSLSRNKDTVVRDTE